jgi:tRNA threonylcarbamoyladenosine biosynthesis protein TsaE
MITVLILKEHALDALVEEIKKLLPKGGVVLLKGDLAAGKTTLVKKFAQYMGIQEAVTSPTFSLQQIYEDTLYHYDIYNKGFEHFIQMGLFDELEKEGYHFIEWADSALEALLKSTGFEYITIEIQKRNDSSRRYKVEYA